VSTSNAGPGEREISASTGAATWIKSTYSGPTGGNCAEIAFLADGDVAMRNSRHPGGPVLIFTRAEWDAFLSGARGGEFGLSG
jgi:hypothetical protein